MQNINGEDWDILIVLDACRYDSFKIHHKDYLQGNLEKRESRGTQTVEWLIKTFPKEYEYTYISGNPFINSLGKTVGETTTEYDSSWNPTNHFKKIYDAWNDVWSKEYKTLLPMDLTNYSLGKIDDRTIIHYVQPHRPYITSEVANECWRARDRTTGDGIEKSDKRKFIDKFNFIFRPVWNPLPRTWKWKIKNLIGLEPNDWRKYYLEGRMNEFVHYYHKNLRIALDAVRKLVKEVDDDKKIIVTADHGEAFGEKGEFGHAPNRDIPELKNVPWFEVTGIVEDGEEKDLVYRKEESDDGKEIKEKLERLGYM